jgi:hypothetical protein
VDVSTVFTEEETTAKGTWIFVDYGHGGLALPERDGTGAFLTASQPAIRMASGTTVERVNFYYPYQRRVYNPGILSSQPGSGALVQRYSWASALGWNRTQGRPLPTFPTLVTADPPEWTPVPYPATIWAGGATRLNIRECFFRNSYIAIDASDPHETLHVSDCYGFPLYVGLLLGRSSDNDRYTRIFWNPNCWRRQGVPDDGLGDQVQQWTRRNGIAYLVMDFAEWATFEQCMSFGYRRGFWFLPSPSSGVMTGCGADGSLEPLRLEGADGMRVLGFTGVQLPDDLDPARTVLQRGAIYVGRRNATEPAPTDILIDSANLGRVEGSDGVQIAAGARITVSRAFIRGYGSNARISDSAAVRIEGGESITVEASTFDGSNPARQRKGVHVLGGSYIRIGGNQFAFVNGVALEIHADARYVLASGNVFRGGLQAISAPTRADIKADPGSNLIG